ncbi:hypothetical protein ACFQ44_09810 [Levilactobacillus lanxiensis]|uniref:Uncharacterized protein n=1 Tax=Levilactobacillus lanxiensis TaxID=2799568 RepID=A0ABW4D382_9LACO|nr:hypothetical protein [Levilactobacillus lanxiensis]
MHVVQQNSKLQEGLFGVTLLLLILAALTTQPIVLAVISFLALVTLTGHFDFFTTTKDHHFLNEADLALQILLLLIAVLKFILLSHATVV